MTNGQPAAEVGEAGTEESSSLVEAIDEAPSSGASVGRGGCVRDEPEPDEAEPDEAPDAEVPMRAVSDYVYR